MHVIVEAHETSARVVNFGKVLHFFLDHLVLEPSMQGDSLIYSLNTGCMKPCHMHP